MPSVVTYWQGSCVDRKAQRRLIGYAEKLSNLSLARIAPAEPKPLFLEKLSEWHRTGTTPQAHRVRFNGKVTGNIVVDAGLFLDPQLAMCQAVDAGLKVVGAENSDGLIKLDLIHLYGVDFELFDFRGLYPGENRMSFVFTWHPKYDFLNGCIVAAMDEAKLTAAGNPLIRDADWYLHCPTLHLRYYLEDWFDALFAWVKYYFMPDLEYWRYESLPGFKEAKQTWDEFGHQEPGPGRMNAEANAFKQLCGRFMGEADEWTENMKGI